MVTKSASFSNQKRLRTPEHFTTLRGCGKTMKLNNLLVTFAPNTKTCPRLGISVSKKRAKLAVHRNTIKRAIRESFRLNQLNLKNIDVLVTVIGKIDGLGAIAALKRQVPGIWQKVSVKVA